MCLPHVFKDLFVGNHGTFGYRERHLSCENSSTDSLWVVMMELIGQLSKCQPKSGGGGRGCGHGRGGRGRGRGRAAAAAAS